MKIQFNGSEKIAYLVKENRDPQNPKIDASWIYGEWKQWVRSPSNMKYLQAMRSIGGDPLSATKYIAPYYEVMNGWNIKPYDGTYILTVVGNLFGSGGRFPFVGADNGTVMVSMETTGNALALQTSSCEAADTDAPVWNGAVGITDAHQDGDGIQISWGSATDSSGSVVYNVYIAKDLDRLWQYRLGSFDGSLLMIYTEADGITPLQAGQAYYIGVRAMDAAGNETDNTNYATISYNGVSVYDEIINKLDGIASMIGELLDVEEGNWKIENTQMIFYRRDGSELMRFDLFDENGSPSNKSVFRRERV